MKKRIFGLAMAGVLTASVVGMAACGESKGENELWITYYNGGYGQEWATQLARNFEEENAGVTVRVDEDTQLIDAVGNMMENGTNYDLIFCHDVAWEDFVYPGWIHSLDNLFATKVDAKGHEDPTASTTFADYIWDSDVLDSCSYIKDGTSHYYKVPWTIGTAGIAFNVSVMDRVDGWLAGTRGQAYLATAEGGGDVSRRWNQTPPATYYDLWQYCQDIVKANLPYDNTPNSKVIYPFTWSAKEEQYQWDYVLFDWWGQLAGPETMNTFKNFGNTSTKGSGLIDWTAAYDRSKVNMEVYNPEKHAVVKKEDGTVDKEASDYVGWAEFKEAYTLWYDLVAQNDTWSYPDIGAYGKFENEQAFVYGRAAMTPAACWIEYESREALEKSKQVISIMPTPTVSNVQINENGEVVYPTDSDWNAATNTKIDAIRAAAGETKNVKTVTDKEGNTYNYNRVSFTSSFGDSVMIPECSKNIDLAEKFILFMAREENAQLFTRVSGGTILPYKYDYSNSFAVAGQTASLWQKAIFEIDNNSTKFNNYTKHPMMRDTNIKDTARMTSVWPRNVYYYTRAWQNASAYKPAELINNTIYNNTVKTGWDMWLNQYIK